MLTQRTRLFLGGGVILAAFVAGVAWNEAKSAPVLKIATTGTNQLLLSITNGVSTTIYQVNLRRALDTSNPWIYLTNGTAGVTNFTLQIGNHNPGFFQVVEGLDWDLDGTPDWKDAQPTNAGIGLLWVTIDSPANGETLNN